MFQIKNKTKKQLLFGVSILLAVPLLLAGLLASCSHDSSGSSTTNPTNTNSSAPPLPLRASACNGASSSFDKNGDGKVKMGVATPGPRDDGGYYQALVETAQRISKQNCYEDVVVVDKISPAEAEPLLRGLAQQDVDFIAVGGTDIATPLKNLIPDFPKIVWYCNCGSNYEEIDRLIQSRDDSSEINFTAGAAVGLLLERSPAGKSGEGRALFLGCCDLDFERESFVAFERGLKAKNSGFEATYVPTGAFTFDFNNVDEAVQALEARKDDVDAVYPFLGGAHEPVVQRANRENIITLSAGASNVCERTDLNYDVAVRFDAGDYLDTILSEIISGELAEGEIRVFRVGVDDEVGAKICNPTPEEEALLNAIYTQIGAGDLKSLFAEIKAEVYG